jgi:hypothetical protein
LAWSPAEDSIGEEKNLEDTIPILWNGHRCFSWTGDKIRCAGPNEDELAKMIDMAVELDANVVGADGEEYH